MNVLSCAAWPERPREGTVIWTRVNKLHAQLEIMFQVSPRRQAILPISPPSTQYTRTPAAASGEQESRVEETRRSLSVGAHPTIRLDPVVEMLLPILPPPPETRALLELLHSCFQLSNLQRWWRTLRLLCFLPPPPPPTHARMDFYVGRWTVKRRNVTKIN